MELYGIDSLRHDTENKEMMGLWPNPETRRGIEDASNHYSIAVFGRPGNRRGRISGNVGYSGPFIHF